MATVLRLNIRPATPLPPIATLYDYGAPLPNEARIEYAAQDISGSLIDLDISIREARTVKEAVDLHAILTTITARAVRLERLALKRADVISGGNAA